MVWADTGQYKISQCVLNVMIQWFFHISDSIIWTCIIYSGEKSSGPLKILANIFISNTNLRNIFTLKQFLEFRPLEIKRKLNIHKISKACKGKGFP